MSKPRIKKVGDKWSCAGVLTVYGTSPQDVYDYYKLELATWSLIGGFKDEFKKVGGGFCARLWLKACAWLMVYVGATERWRYEP